MDVTESGDGSGWRNNNGTAVDDADKDLDFALSNEIVSERENDDVKLWLEK